MAKKSLMRNLGELVGGVLWGAKTKPEDVPARRKPEPPPAKGSRTQTLRSSEERGETRGPNGERVTLRRTTVEEMTIEPMEGREHL